MPLYEYICTNKNCETKVFEILSSFQLEETTPQRCPSCKNKTEVKKDFYQNTFKM